MKPRVSVIICSRNRAEILERTIRAIGKVAVPRDLPTELLVVDNGSTDTTPRIVESASTTNMAVIRATEPAPGKCRALNRALSEAHGDILLFTDDDVSPPSDWIEGMCRPIADGRADAVAGGIVFPVDYEPIMSRAPYLQRRDWFASSERLDAKRVNRMIGANMAFGRHVLGRVPTFDTNLGPSALGFCEETLFAFQLVDQGFRIIPALDVAVEHHFDRSRLRRSTMLESAYRLGRSNAYLAWHWRQETFSISPFTYLRRLVGLWRRRLLHLRDWIGTDVPSDWELTVIESLGFQRQYLIESRLPRRYQCRSQSAGSAIGR